MCRSSPVDSHYNRDEDEHRNEYREAYPELRVMEEPAATAETHKEIQDLKNQVRLLRQGIEEQGEYIDLLRLSLPSEAFRSPKEEAKVILKALELMYPERFQEMRKKMKEEKEKDGV